MNINDVTSLNFVYFSFDIKNDLFKIITNSHIVHNAQETLTKLLLAYRLNFDLFFLPLF